MFQTNNTDAFHNDTEKSVNTDDCVYTVNTSKSRMVAATRLAYDEFIDFLGGLTEYFRPGEIKEVESRNIENEGTRFKIKFEIDYIPDGVTMDCVTIVLEYLANTFEVQNVTCDCCVE